MHFEDALLFSNHPLVLAATMFPIRPVRFCDR
jgi:hypothetical protein